MGFGNEKILAPMFAAWTEIIDKYKPDLLIADYAPFALLASHGLGFRRVNIGLPFYCPPDVFPLPRWGNPEQMKDATHLLETERQITDQVNRLLAQHNRPQLKQMASLFNQVDGIFLATYPELDPYGARSGIRYWGHWNVSTGLDVKWPEGRGAKIFAYLKPFPGLEELLRQFKESDCPTIAVSHQISPELQERYKAPTMLFENRPLNMSAIAAGCDLAIFHAGHGTIASMLLAGKPCLLFPKYIEQSLNAQAVLKLGAGRMLAASMILQIGPALLDMQITDRYKNARGALRAIQGKRARRAGPADRRRSLSGSRPMPRGNLTLVGIQGLRCGATALGAGASARAHHRQAPAPAKTRPETPEVL